MKNIVFFDHAAHRQTRSSDFFVDILRQAFDVEIRYVEAERILLPKTLAIDPAADLVVLWQLDYLAPFFLAQHRRTVVVPMFDGSGTLGDSHWLASRGARFVNFSYNLHTKLVRLNCTSFLARYFPPASLPDGGGAFASCMVFFGSGGPTKATTSDWSRRFSVLA